MINTLNSEEELELCLEDINKKMLSISKRNGWFFFSPSQKTTIYNYGESSSKELNLEISLFKEKFKNKTKYNIEEFNVFKKGIYLVGFLDPFRSDESLVSIVINYLNSEEPNSAVLKETEDELKVMYKGKEILARFIGSKGLVLFLYNGLEELPKNNIDFTNNIIKIIEGNIKYEKFDKN